MQPVASGSVGLVVLTFLIQMFKDQFGLSGTKLQLLVALLGAAVGGAVAWLDNGTATAQGLTALIGIVAPTGIHQLLLDGEEALFGGRAGTFLKGLGALVVAAFKPKPTPTKPV